MKDKIKKIKAVVSESKKKTLSEIEKLMKENRTILIASIKNLPSSNYQEIVKKLRGKAVVKLPKKNVVLIALKKIDDEVSENLRDKIEEGTVFLFSNTDAFELAGELTESKIPTRAKAGQEAPFDIEVPAGPTELTPGPAISELGVLGIQVQIEKGKINIKEPKIIARKGEKIKSEAVDVMGKLGIKPFFVGFAPLAAYDTKEKKLYLKIEVNKKDAIEKLKKAYQESFNLAVGISYATKETIKFLIGKAERQFKAIEKFVEN